MTSVDHWVARLLAPLGAWVLVSGLDDLALVVVCAVAWLVRRLRRQTCPLWPGEEGTNRTRRNWTVTLPAGVPLPHNYAAGAPPNQQPALPFLARQAD